MASSTTCGKGKKKIKEKNMERKVSGYYGTGEELLVPIAGKSIVLRKAGEVEI